MDGYHKETNTAYEFFGCYYHGCPCLADNQSYRSQQLYQNTLNKIEDLEKHGIKVERVWEHEFDEKLPGLDFENREYIKRRMSYYYSIKEVGRLNPRDAFLAERTCNFVMSYNTETGENKCFCNRCDGFNCRGLMEEQIEYQDFTSEYPFVLKNRKFPIGNPKSSKNFI